MQGGGSRDRHNSFPEVRQQRLEFGKEGAYGIWGQSNGEESAAWNKSSRAMQRLPLESETEYEVLHV